MKRFDFAGEVAKQLITISSVIITVIIAFYEKFFSHGLLVFCLVLADMLILVVSIFAGIMSLGGIVTLVEIEERNSHEAELHKARPKSSHELSSGVFVTITGSMAARCARWQQGLFIVGLAGFTLIAFVDRISFGRWS